MNDLLEIMDLSYSYRDGESERVIFDYLNMSFREGILYAICGPSGCGKTTLLYILGGLDRRYKGKVLFKGKDIKEISTDNYRRKHVSMIFQNYNIISYLSPVRNIRIALDIAQKQKSTQEIVALLNILGIDKKKAKRKAGTLSGGEQQRVSVARALATDTEIILADEATGNLDQETGEKVFALFEKMAHENNKCVIMVTHNPQIAEQADICIKLG